MSTDLVALALTLVGERIVISSTTEAQTTVIPAGVETIQTTGYAAPADGGGAVYKHVTAEPSHPGKFQSADGAWWELAVSEVTPWMFGAAGVSGTNDKTSIQNSASAAVGLSIPLRLEGVFYLTYWDITTPGLQIRSSGAKLVAEGTTESQGGSINSYFFRPNAANITIDGDLELDGNLQAHRVVHATTNATGLRQWGLLHLHHAQPTDATANDYDLNGGWYSDNLSDVRLDEVLIHDTYQWSDHRHGNFGAMRTPSCSDIHINKLTIYNSDQALNIHSAFDGHVGELIVQNITDNGLYAGGTAHDWTFGLVDLTNVEEGVVLNVSTAYGPSNIVVNSLTCRTASNGGIVLRTGSGYFFGAAILIDSNMEQGSGSGVSNLTINSLTIKLNSGFNAGKNPVNLIDDTAVTIGVLNLMVDTNGAGGEFINMSGACDNLLIGAANINYTGATFIPIMNYSAVSTTAPKITIGAVVKAGQVGSINAGSVSSTNVSYVEPGGFWRGVTPSTNNFALTNSKTALAVDEVVGGYQIRTMDASGGATPRTIATMRAVSNDSSGSTFRLEFLDDTGNVVGVIRPGGAGASFKLPTSAADCVSGGVWNNAGVLTIKP